LLAQKPQRRAKPFESKELKKPIKRKKNKSYGLNQAIRPWGFLCGFVALREAPLTFNGHFYSKVPEQLQEVFPFRIQ